MQPTSASFSDHGNTTTPRAEDGTPRAEPTAAHQAASTGTPLTGEYRGILAQWGVYTKKSVACATSLQACCSVNCRLQPGQAVNHGAVMNMVGPLAATGNLCCSPSACISCGMYIISGMQACDHLSCLCETASALCRQLAETYHPSLICN